MGIILVDQISTEMRNVCQPLPMMVHVVFCVIATLVYLLQFYRKKSVTYIFLTIAADITLVTQFWTSDKVIMALGICEALLLAASLVLAIRHSKEEKRKKLEEKEKEESDTETEKNNFSDSDKSDNG